MAQHGYLREFDEGPDHGDRDRDWSTEDRDRNWRGSDRGFMFDRGSDDDDGRGFIDRMGDRARSWFGDDDDQYRGTHGNDWSSRGQGSRGYDREHESGGFRSDSNRGGRQQGGFRSSGERSRRNFSSRQDDHYLSWRDRQIDALDRDYADYCREREQQFHSDFDNWRRTRQQSGPQLEGQSDGTGEAAELELTQERAVAEQGNSPSPSGEATLGTNNSENTLGGRR